MRQGVKEPAQLDVRRQGTAAGEEEDGFGPGMVTERPTAADDWAIDQLTGSAERRRLINVSDFQAFVVPGIERQDVALGVDPDKIDESRLVEMGIEKHSATRLHGGGARFFDEYGLQGAVGRANENTQL